MSLLPFALFVGLVPGTAQAYVGPGIGLGVLGTLAGILLALVFAVYSFVWHPLKRLLRGKKQRSENAADSETAEESDRHRP